MYNSITNQSLNQHTITTLQQILLAILAGGLLSIGFLNHNLYLFPWIAFVPFLFAIKNTNLPRAYFLGLVTGLVTFITGEYWIVNFIMLSKGYGLISSIFLAIIYWIYSAHLFAFVAFLFNGLARSGKLHEFLLFPIIIVALTSGFPMLSAVHLGETQVNFRVALQAIEFTGVQGLDFIIALVNIMVYRLASIFATRERFGRSFFNYPWGLALVVVSTWCLYGFIVNPLWENKIKHWNSLSVGIVQPNEAPSLDSETLRPGYSRAYPIEMEMTERLVKAGAELVVWPEARYKGYYDQEKTRHAFQRQIKALETSLIFQDMQNIRNPINDRLTDRYNSVTMLDNNGNQSPQYNKIMRIPFGEYVPLVSNIPALRSWVESFFGKFLSEISKGTHYTAFEHKGISIIPLICYETTFSEFVGEAVDHSVTTFNPTQGNLILGLSNNGWFGATHQPYQHVIASVLRSVENRLPFVHVVNNGPSIVVVPSGQIIFTSEFQRAAGYVIDVPYSKTAQGSFYSRHPRWFIYSVYLALLVIIFAVLTKAYCNPSNKYNL